MLDTEESWTGSNIVSDEDERVFSLCNDQSLTTGQWTKEDWRMQERIAQNKGQKRGKLSGKQVFRTKTFRTGKKCVNYNLQQISA